MQTINKFAVSRAVVGTVNRHLLKKKPAGAAFSGLAIPVRRRRSGPVGKTVPRTTLVKLHRLQPCDKKPSNPSPCRSNARVSSRTAIR